MSKTEKPNYHKLAKAMMTIIDSGYVDASRVYWVSFFRGVFYGLGFALGGSLVIGLLIYLLSLFSEIPFLGDITEAIRRSIEAEGL